MPLQNESYVISLCDEVLGIPSSRHHTFSWLLGDSSPKSGRRRALPVDAYWPTLALVVEFHERQHSQAVPHFDRRETVSGVTRGVQRRLYDERRALTLPQHGITLVVISMQDFLVRRGRIVPDRNHDTAVVKRHLARYR